MISYNGSFISRACCVVDAQLSILLLPEVPCFPKLSTCKQEAREAVLDEIYVDFSKILRISGKS